MLKPNGVRLNLGVRDSGKQRKGVKQAVVPRKRLKRLFLRGQWLQAEHGQWRMPEAGVHSANYRGDIKDMKRILGKFSVAMVMIGVWASAAHALSITSDEYIGSGGAGTGESLAGDRFRSFQPTGADENYLGVPSLGTAGNRVAQQVNWMNPDNSLQSFDFTFVYDQANDQLVSTINGGTIFWDDWSTTLASRGKTKGAADLNAFQITIKQGDIGSVVYLTDMELDGNALGDFYGVDGLNKNWLVTGSDMNLTDGFTLTGTLWLQGAFSSSQENSAVNLAAGWDTRGVAPVPEPATISIMGLGLVSLTVARKIRSRLEVKK